MTETESTRQALRIILANQKTIMLALKTQLLNNGGMATGYHANELQMRFDRTDDWLQRNRI